MITILLKVNVVKKKIELVGSPMTIWQIGIGEFVIRRHSNLKKTFQGTYSVRFLSFNCNQFAKIGRYIKRDIYWITSRININIKETVFRQIQFKAFSFSSNSVKRILFRLLVTFSSLQTFAADIFSDALLLYLQGPKE